MVQPLFYPKTLQSKLYKSDTKGSGLMGVSIIIRVINQAWGQEILTEQAWLIKDFSVIRPKENIFSPEQNGQSRVPSRVANQNAGFASSFARSGGRPYNKHGDCTKCNLFGSKGLFVLSTTEIEMCPCTLKFGKLNSPSKKIAPFHLTQQSEIWPN